ncbi:MAG: YceH family protein [Actinomycetota bacterium]|nr:YceH family protein [Actinomycetota bacterium]
MNLEAEEVRVVGCLMEKQLTTPQQYPLTINALVAACNQASNRQPVVAYDQWTVESIVVSLKDRGLVRFVHPSHGRSATRYRQVLDEALGLDSRQVALLAVLLLRGPQTTGELRARSERMAAFSGLDEVDEVLQTLASGDDPLVVQLAREPGRREVRYTHLLGGEPVGAEVTSPGPVPGLEERSVPSLADEVAALRAEVTSLRSDLDHLRAMLDET